MENSPTPRSLSELLQDLKDSLTTPEISASAILEAFHERGFGFFLFLLALPAALPVPALGMSSLLAIPLMFLTVQQIAGRHTIWVPDTWRAKTIKSATLENLIDKVLPYIQRGEKLIHPRLGFLTHGYFSNLIGLCGFIMTISIALPIPLTNTVPSMGVCLMAVGIMMRDGLAVILGALVGLGWIALFIFVVMFFGIEGLDMAKESVKSWF